MRMLELAGVMIGLLVATLPAYAAAQVVEPAGREGNARIAVHVDETFRRADGSIQARLFEIPDASRNGVRYAIISADYDCSKRERSLLLREEFSSMRDPVRQVFQPARVARDANSAAVAQQLLVLCDEARSSVSAPVTLTDMLDGSR